MTDRVERHVTKRNEIAVHQNMKEEFAHEFASPRDYKEALINKFHESQRVQNIKKKPSIDE